MAFRDRFWTPTTAKAILSWRLLLGAAVGVLAGLLGVPIVLAAVLGIVVYAGAVWLAMPKPTSAPTMDPFTVGEPWRRFVQAGHRAQRRFMETVAATPPGPLRDRLQRIGERLEAGLAEGWAVAKQGDQIDRNIRKLDPTALRSRLQVLQQRAASAPSPELTASIESVQAQLDTVERLKQLSASAADRLRLTQSRLDELVARAAEVSIGSSDTDRLAHDVDDLVVELTGLHQAVQELPR
jgi:hypothetical protein